MIGREHQAGGLAGRLPKANKHGIKTPRQDVDIIERRYRQALKIEKES